MDELTLTFSFLLTLYLSVSGINSTTFTVVNKCNFTVWPASSSSGAALSTTGFSLQTDESQAIDAPTAWNGRFWGRTGCKLDSTGSFSCATGDCGSGTVACGGSTSTSPNTLIEFSLASDSQNEDFYDVSLLDGYNLPVMVVPGGFSGTNCTSIGCIVDINGECPLELRVYSDNQKVNVVGCKSACAETCSLTKYSFFKTACPQAYVDESTFACSSADYTITFCPVSNSRTGSSLLATKSTLVQFSQGNLTARHSSK